MSSRVLTRVLLSVIAGALCGVVAACAVVLLDGRGGTPGGPEEVVDPVPPATTGRSDPGAARRAREVLRAWDAARAEAWTATDPRGLAALYAPGSVAGRRDVAMLRAWRERGARVTRLTTQVLRLQVLAERPRRLVLVVTDRVALVRVGEVRLPEDRASTRRVVLVGGAGRWRVASVSDRPVPW